MAAKNAKPAKTSSKKSDDSFIPDEATSGGSNRYMKFDELNKFRAISNPIFGWLEWVDDGDGKKPIRTKLDEEPEGGDDENKPKKFMTLVVVDRNDDNKIKILEITQQSVIKAIKALSANPDWGSPFTYDLNVEKKGEGMKTRYTVTPSPKKALDKSVIKEAQDTFVCLDALYEGEDPWNEESGEATELIFK